MTFSWLWMAMCALPAGQLPSTHPANPVDYVVKIDWHRFDQTRRLSAETQRCARLLNGCLRYSLPWAEHSHKRSADGSRYLLQGMKESDIRMPASVAIAGAIALKTGCYEEKSARLSRRDATESVNRLIRTVAGTHLTNARGKTWGDDWQTALWAVAAGHAGWLMWDELDDETRTMVARMVEFEADRYLRPDYKVPYWNGAGGDTKAEENAWNAMIHQLAVAMMPHHPHVSGWKRIGSELMVSAYAAQDDWESNLAVVDGKSVKDWLHGYNLRQDGAVINHNIVHCDYMACIMLNLRAFLTQPLAGQAVPQSARFNSDRVYRALITQNWPAPPYQPPGGTMYIPGQPEVYYPQGTDWSRFRFDVFYEIDMLADRLNLDRNLPHKAAEWIALRGQRLEEMQARHADGRVFAAGEFTTYLGAEQESAWLFADTLLFSWLADHVKIDNEANWNQP